jgi:hypothetical protein
MCIAVYKGSDGVRSSKGISGLVKVLDERFQQYNRVPMLRQEHIEGVHLLHKVNE